MTDPQRILLVEDDPQVAALLADLLEDAEFQVDGPYASLEDGVAAVAARFPDGAVVDIRLKGHDAGLLAHDLENYAIPYLFCSGLDDDPVAMAHPNVPLILKPLIGQQLIPALKEILH